MNVKLFISAASDRDAVALALIRNGYPVRYGSGKRSPEDKKRSAYIEVIDPVRITAEPEAEA